MMRPACGFLASCVFVGSLMVATTAGAQNMTATADTPPLTGLWLTTNYPSITEPIGKDVNIQLSLINKNLPPERVALSVENLPDGWDWQIKGGGNAVGAAIVGDNDNVNLTLDLKPPAKAEAKSYDFRVVGKSTDQTLELPMTLTLSAAQPASVTIEPKLPALRGTPKSTFDYDVTVKNDGATDQVFNLVAEAPAGFQAVFKEQYGTQELTSIPLKAGESKDLKVSVTPAHNAAAGQYPVIVHVASPTLQAATKLVLDVTGQPTLALSGPEGRLSGDATAGKERTFNFTLANSGTAPVQNVKLNASAPSGWKVAFDPKQIDALGPDQQAQVAVSMTPSDKAIAGDYVVSVRATGDGASDSANFRVTVLTSTMWGIAGLGVIGAAVVVLAVAVTRYGRR